jgi:outer membrane protein TolC
MKSIISYILLLFVLYSNAQTKNLDYFIEQAKLNSSLINNSKAENKLILLDIKQLKSVLRKPQIDIEADMMFSPIISHDNGNQFQFISDGSVTDYSGYDLAYTNGGQYQAFASIKQPLLTKSRFKAYSQKADISNKININNIKLTEHELKQLVSYQYIICLRKKKQKEITYNLLKSLEEQLNIMQKLVENAIYQQTDLTLLKIEVKNYQIDVNKYTAEFKNSIADLQIVCGMNDTNITDIENMNFKLNYKIIDKSDFLVKFTLDSLNVIAKQTLFNQKYKPQINLFADVGINSIYIPSFNRFGMSGGLSFTINIFDGGQKRIQKDKALVELSAIEFDKQGFINLYSVNRAKYLNQISSIKQRVEVVNEQIEQYNNLIKQYKIKLSQGQVSIMDIKLIIRDIALKNQELVDLQTEEQILINDYNYWNF